MGPRKRRKTNGMHDFSRRSTVNESTRTETPGNWLAFSPNPVKLPLRCGAPDTIRPLRGLASVPKLSIVCLAACCGCVTGGGAWAQSLPNLYYDEAGGQLKAETAIYTEMVQSLQSTGQPDPRAASFLFSVAGANSPLFDPEFAARRTLSDAKNGDDACQTLAATEVIAYASYGVVATSLDDPSATLNHLAAIDEALAVGTVSLTITGGDLVSEGLPLTKESGGPLPPPVYEADTPITAWMVAIEAHAVQVAASFNPADDVKNRLLGTPRHVDQLAESIWNHSLTAMEDVPDDIIVLRATFGVYGSLPLLAVFAGDTYFLVDGVNGYADGPFKETQPFDATALLAAHAEYVVGSATRVLDRSGLCEATPVAKRWREDRPPGTYTPMPAVMMPCPTPQNPSAICPAPQAPYVAPVPPILWPTGRCEWYPYSAPESGFPGKACPTAPIPLVPTIDLTNPGIPGNPTNWKCTTLPNNIGDPVEFCGTIEQVCTPAGICIPRLVVCVFDPPPSRNGTPPNGDYPPYPAPMDFDTPNSPLSNIPVTNPNRCFERFYR